MIGRLRGILLEKKAPYLLVEVAGVAYEMQASMTSFYPMPAEGEEVILHTHLSISENAHQLFAFYTQEERQLFRMLIKVSGVGPKMALAILSGMAAAEFVACVQTENAAALVKVPGVGKKTAERLIIEVKDKLTNWQNSSSPQIKVDGAMASHQSSRSMITDAESALVVLGYKPTDAAKVIAQVQRSASPSNSEELIRLALKNLAR
jgi:Holliday junction DNA helicase RuvA